MAAAEGAEAAEAPSSLLLVVGGECGCPGLLAYVLEELERGGDAGGWRGVRAGWVGAWSGAVIDRVGWGSRRDSGGGSAAVRAWSVGFGCVRLCVGCPWGPRGVPGGD
jgi:hypothetical protein